MTGFSDAGEVGTLSALDGSQRGETCEFQRWNSMRLWCDRTYFEDSRKARSKISFPRRDGLRRAALRIPNRSDAEVAARVNVYGALEQGSQRCGGGRMWGVIQKGAERASSAGTARAPTNPQGESIKESLGKQEETLGVNRPEITLPSMELARRRRRGRQRPHDGWELREQRSAQQVGSHQDNPSGSVEGTA